MSNQQINCCVRSCRHNDQKEHCKLTSIKVGNTCETPHQCDETECDSFEA